jgi:hypothetical protein
MKRFVFGLVLVSVLPLYSQAPERPFEDAPGPRMTRHAVIRVLPSERLRQEQVQREQILELVHTMLLTRTHISTSDPVIRQQLELEERLAEAVRVHLDDDFSDAGKNGIAMSVETKLNAMEGQYNCGACHGRSSLDVARSR